MHWVRTYRTEGEGRTKSGLPHATGSSKPALTVGAWLILLAAASLRFTMDTASVGRLDERVVVGASAVLAGLLVGLVHWPPRRGAAPRVRLSAFDLVRLAAASLLATVVTPLWVFANRYSDAPPGSVVAFWTTVFLGSLLVAAGSSAGSRPAVRASAALVLFVSGAGVLANWERPSSFSLFTRYTGPQTAMLLAGVAWVALVSYLSIRVRRDGWPACVAPIVAGPILGGSVLLLMSGDALAGIFSPIILLAAGAFAVLYLMTLSLGPAKGALLSGTAIAAAPAAITLLAVLELATGMLGPRPLLLAPVIASCGVGACAIWLILLDHAKDTAPASRFKAWIVALVGVVAAGIGLVTPALSVAVRGGLSSGEAFSADFSMAGFETVAGWLAFSIALTVYFITRSAPGSTAAIAAFVAAVVAVIAWIILRPMPLHTWVSWIPAEVQQDYGTEFASLVFTPAASFGQMIALALATVASGVAVWQARAIHRLEHDSATPLVEGRT